MKGVGLVEGNDMVVRWVRLKQNINLMNVV